jgi:hypothetical protein
MPKNRTRRENAMNGEVTLAILEAERADRELEVYRSRAHAAWERVLKAEQDLTTNLEKTPRYQLERDIAKRGVVSARARVKKLSRPV